MLVQNDKVVPLPDYGDHMTLDQFIECCKRVFGYAINK